MPGRPPVRVLVLDASGPRRERLRRLLQGQPPLEVVGTAAAAEDAIEAAGRLQPHVILAGQGHAADMVAATRSIMQARATPIVVMTAAAGEADTGHAFALMEAGALAVVQDPGEPGEARHAADLQRLLTTLRVMAEVRVVRRWAGAAGDRGASGRRAAGERATQRLAGRKGVALVAIGASTGGPVALKKLLAGLPAQFPVPIVVVQHMAGGFLQGMAQWLSASCALPVAMACPDTELLPGRVYLAPDGMHMRVAADGALAFDDAAPVNGHRPAVSCLLASVAAHYGSRAIGILLTGMGKDGAAELKLMKDAGAVTIAQDQASSVVHGMPGEAIRSGAATYVMSPEEIGASLPALVLR